MAAEGGQQPPPPGGGVGGQEVDGGHHGVGGDQAGVQTVDEGTWTKVGHKRSARPNTKNRKKNKMARTADPSFLQGAGRNAASFSEARGRGSHSGSYGRNAASFSEARGRGSYSGRNAASFSEARGRGFSSTPAPGQGKYFFKRPYNQRDDSFPPLEAKGKASAASAAVSPTIRETPEAGQRHLTSKSSNNANNNTKGPKNTIGNGSGRSYAKTVATLSPEEIAAKKANEATVQVAMYNEKGEHVLLNSKVDMDHIWQALMSELLRGKSNKKAIKIPTAYRLGFNEGLGLVTLDKADVSLTCKCLNNLKLSLGKVKFTLKAQPFQKAIRNIRCDMWAPFWGTPTDKAANIAAANEALEFVFERNDLPGKWSQAKVLREGNAVRFNWVPDETLSKALLDRLTDKDSKEIHGIEYMGWHRPVTIRIFDIEAIKADRAQYKANLAMAAKNNTSPQDQTMEVEGKTVHLDQGKYQSNGLKRRRVINKKSSTDLSNVTARMEQSSLSNTSSEEEDEKVTPRRKKKVIPQPFLVDIVPKNLHYLLYPYVGEEEENDAIIQKAFERGRRTVMKLEEALALEKAFFKSTYVRTTMTIDDRTAFELLLQNTLGRTLNAKGDDDDWASQTE